MVPKQFRKYEVIPIGLSETVGRKTRYIRFPNRRGAIIKQNPSIPGHCWMHPIVWDKNDELFSLDKSSSVGLLCEDGGLVLPSAEDLERNLLELAA